MFVFISMLLWRLTLLVCLFGTYFGYLSYLEAKNMCTIVFLLGRFTSMCSFQLSHGIPQRLTVILLYVDSLA